MKPFFFKLVLISFVLLGSAEPHTNAFATESGRSVSIRDGERIYRDGILSDGTPLKGYVRGDVEIDSTVFSCANCHTRSGLGAIEGQMTAPPVNGTSLFNPAYLFKDQIKNTISKSRGVTRSAPALRPSYTPETLAIALREGTTPTGRELASVMPRYLIDDIDMNNLAAYLKNLSSAHSPGVTETSITFATIVTDDVSAQDRQALLASLDTLVTINRQTKNQRKDPRFYKMFRMLDSAFFKEISIRTWELKGAPSTWKSQLQEYYKREPVFAVLGGISGKSWQPIHDFCEESQLPCLFPITDLPVISDSSWYTFYTSKGFYQEGLTAARFLANRKHEGARRKILHIVKTTDEGTALASGFTSNWDTADDGELITLRISPEESLDTVYLLRSIREHSPDAIVLWAGEDAVKVVAQTATAVALPPVYVSSRLLGTTLFTIPESLRDTLYITYPFRMPENEKAFANHAESLSLGKLIAPDGKRIASRTFSMIHIFLLGLKDMKLNYYRDTMLDAISMLADQYLPDFERFSFGPGQRYASKGCYIVQLGKGLNPRLVRKSDWVVF